MSELQTIIAGEFASRGMEAEAAERLAQFVEAAAEIIAREKVLSFLGKLKNTRAGTALLLAFGDEEGIRPAARRLNMSPGSLATMVRKYKHEITGGKV